MRSIHLTIAILLAIVLYAANGPDVQARSHAGCSAPAASCGAQRSILRNRPHLIGRALTAPLRAAGRLRFRPQPRFGCGG
jgi:hypothetical protein